MFVDADFQMRRNPRCGLSWEAVNSIK